MPSTESNATQPYWWLPAAWAAVVYFHLAGNSLWLDDFGLIALFQVVWLVAAITFGTTQRPVAHMVAFGSHVIVFALKAPLVGNHELLMLLVEAVGVGALLTASAAPGAATHWLGRWAQGSRAVLLVAYTAFAFSKLNVDFLDPAVSCAAVFAREFGLPIESSGVLPRSAAIFALATESAIAIMLWVPRWRRYAVWLGLAFHFLLALEPLGHVFDFSAVLFVLFALFVPGLDEDLRAAVDRLFAKATMSPLVAALAIVACTALVVARGAPGLLIGWPVWMAVGGGWLVFVSKRARRPRSDADRPVFSGLALASWLIVGLALMNAASPYLELKTATAFNMYSNLRIVDGESNHLLIRQSIPLRNTPPTVKIIEADTSTLDFYLNNERVPLANLQRFLEDEPEVTFTMQTEDGQLFTVDGNAGIEGLPEHLRGSPSMLAYKFAQIRSFSETEPQSCRRLQGELF